MLSYLLSILTVIFFIFIGIILLFREDFPLFYKAFGRGAKLTRQGVKAGVGRLGCIRFLFLWYIGLAVIFTLVTLASISGQSWLQSVGRLTLIWVPILILRFILRWLSARRVRRLRLPGRER